MGTQKKVINVDNGKSVSSIQSTAPSFSVSPESKKKATQFRIIAVVLWLIAIGLEVWAIWFLKQSPIKMVPLIVLIIFDMIFAIGGSLLWKKANRFDPASEKEKVKFFIQNQLGVIISFIAFLPLIILIFTNKDMNGKQKGILSIIAIAALAITGVTSYDFNPPSVEQYAEQTAKVEDLMGSNHVYWTKSGKHYHLYDDCYTINKDVTTEIYTGTVAQARELKNINDLCKICENNAIKSKEKADSDTEETTP